MEKERVKTVSIGIPCKPGTSEPTRKFFGYFLLDGYYAKTPQRRSSSFRDVDNRNNPIDKHPKVHHSGWPYHHRGPWRTRQVTPTHYANEHAHTRTCSDHRTPVDLFMSLRSYLIVKLALRKSADNRRITASTDKTVTDIMKLSKKNRWMVGAREDGVLEAVHVGGLHVVVWSG